MSLLAPTPSKAIVGASPATKSGVLLRADWALFGMMGLYPLWWVLGVQMFMWAVIPNLMLISVLMRPPIVVPKGFWVWAAFLSWMVVSGTQIDTITRMAVFVLRAGWYFGVTGWMLLLLDRRRVRRTEAILKVLTLMWIFTVVGGLAGLAFPFFSFGTLARAVMPGFLLEDQFVSSMVTPGLADVQEAAGGTPRPRAPYGFTNGWGAALALLTPFAIASIQTPNVGINKRFLQIMLVISVIPGVLSLNRGLWISLSLGLIYAAVRLGARGQVKALAAVLGLCVAVVIALFVTPLGDIATDRVDNGHSDEGRASLYQETIKKVSESPVIGFGGPRPQSSFVQGPSLGTHGHLWLVLMSQGFVGAALYFGFCASMLWHTRSPNTAMGFWGHIAVFIGMIQIFFYGQLPVEIFFIFSGAMIALRESGGDRRSARQRWRPLPPDTALSSAAPAAASATVSTGSGKSLFSRSQPAAPPQTTAARLRDRAALTVGRSYGALGAPASAAAATADTGTTLSPPAPAPDPQPVVVPDPPPPIGPDSDPPRSTPAGHGDEAGDHTETGTPAAPTTPAAKRSESHLAPPAPNQAPPGTSDETSQSDGETTDEAEPPTGPRSGPRSVTPGLWKRSKPGERQIDTTPLVSIAPQQGSVAPNLEPVDSDDPLVWLSSILFGPEAQRQLVRGATPLGPNQRTLAEYLVQDESNPRFLLQNHRRAMATGVHRYHDAMPRSSRLRNRSASIGARTGLASRLWRGRVRLVSSNPLAADGRSSLLTHLAEVLGEDTVFTSLTLGPPKRANRKPVIQMIRPDGQVIAFVKVGWNHTTRELVRNEVSWLRSLEAANLTAFQVPTLLHSGTWRGLEIAAMTAVPSDVRSSRDPHTPPPVQVFHQIAELAGIEEHRLIHSHFARRIENYLRPSPALGTVVRFLEKHRDEDVAFGTWHGDFSPWNMSTTASGLHLLDWEFAAHQVPYGFDCFHFFLQVALVLDQKSAAESLDIARAQGGALLVELGIEPEKIDLIFGCYLAETIARSRFLVSDGEPPRLVRLAEEAEFRLKEIDGTR